MTLPAHLRIGRMDARAGAWSDTPQTWLSVAEQDELAYWRDPGRRGEWLAGRWLLKGMILSTNPRVGSGVDVSRLRRIGAASAGKSVLAAVLRPPLPTPAHPEIEILSRVGYGRGRPPCILAFGRAVPLHVSLAHAGGTVWAALSTSPHHRVGIDIVPRESFHDRAAGLWCTKAEQRWLRHACDQSLAARLWAVKEAVYKATNRGEPFVPARIEVGRHVSGRYTWSRDGVPPDPDDTLFVRRTAESILALAVAHAARAKFGSPP